MRRMARLSIIVAALLLTGAAAGALFGPGLLRERAKAWVAAETGRTLEIGRVGINLLTLSVRIDDLRLSEKGAATPFLRWDRLDLAFSARSLWHRAPVIREMRLENPAVRIERLPQGRFNFSDLLERRSPGSDTSAAEGEPARFSLNNLVILGGRIDLLDRTLATPASHRLEELELAVPFVGNLPYLADRYVEPLLRAKVNGTPLELRGELKPFADIQEYVVKLKLERIDLPRYLAYLPEPLPVAVNNGRLDLDLVLSYRASASAKPVLEVAGRIDLTAIDLRERDGHPLFFLPLLEARLAPSRPLDRHLHLASLHIANPQGWVDRDPAGAWNFNRWRGVPPPSAEPPPAATPAASAPLQLAIDRVRLRDGRLGVRDAQPAGGFATTLTGINLDIDGFSLADHAPFRLALDLGSQRRERLGISGQVTVSPLTLDLAVAAKGLPLAAYLPYYQAQTTAVIGGDAQLSARVQVAPGTPLLVSDTRLEITGLELPLPEEEGLKLAGAVLQGGRYDLAGNRLEIDEVTLNAPALRFSRSKAGHWSFLARDYPLLARLAEPAAAPPPAAGDGPPFSYHIGRILLHDGQLALRDELPREPAQLALSGLDLAVSDLAAPARVPATFALHGRFQKRGGFRASGTMVPAGPEVIAAVELQRIELASLAPYLGERVRLVLVDGTLDARFDAKLYRQHDEWAGQVAGDLGLHRVYLIDAERREDLLRWERLQLAGVDVRLEPLAVKIGSIALDNYFARVLLDEQANLNLAQIFSAEPDDAVTAGGEPPHPPASAAPPRPQVRIGKITLQGGKVNFTDRHLPRAFTAEMTQLGGRIEGLGSDPATRAEVDLRGRLRNESPLRIAGTLNPLAEPLFLDLKLDFNDIELSPLSPYSGTYVGYLIERGKLNVMLAYQVENGRLTATNKLFLDQFDFGAAVESSKATSLPVRLAVALLKDRNGEIHLDIPVSGSLDDPRFSVWGVVWQIIRNLLVKAVTSPLALLGALGGGADVGTITFPYGSTRLTDAELAKVARIAGALRDRPELRLEVKGYVDPEQDPEGYRQEILQNSLRREKLIDLRRRLGEAAPTEASAVTVTAEESPEYLWRVYRQADFPKPRNFIGMLKHLPDAELTKLLLANTRVGADELAALAQARASAVAAALVESGGIPRDRVFLATTDPTALPAEQGTSRSRVEFGMAVK